MSSPGGSIFNIGYGNAGTTTLRKVHDYGGGMGGMGIACHHTGTLQMLNVYCGPPFYQSDRHLTTGGGWAMSTENRAAIVIKNSTFIGTWDDVFDVGCDETAVLSQPAPNQVVVQDNSEGDYQAGDHVEFTDDTNPPVGTEYGQCTITTAVRNGSKDPSGDLLTLSQEVTIHNPAKDCFTDLDQAGPITAIDDTFNSPAGRHVYFRSGISTTVEGCTFKDNTPFIPAGWDFSEGPSEIHNLTVMGNTFLNSMGLDIASNGGSSQAVSGSGATITRNRFISCGRNKQDDCHPLRVWNVANATVANNWFDDDWGTNVQFNYDTNITLAGNTFNRPLERQYPGVSFNIDDWVVWMLNTAGANLAGNRVISSGPFAKELFDQGTGNSDVNGTQTGISTAPPQ